MSDFKKVENKKKRRNEQSSNPKNNEDQELRNYIVKKLKMNTEEKENADFIQQKEQQIGIINVTNNGKSKIKKLVSQGMNELNTLKRVTMQAKDKSISKLISVIEIIKQTLGKSNIIQQNHIYNMQDQQCKKQACMKISLIYNPDKGVQIAQN